MARLPSVSGPSVRSKCITDIVFLDFETLDTRLEYLDKDFDLSGGRDIVSHYCISSNGCRREDI